MLSAVQQSIFERVDAKAISMGLVLISGAQPHPTSKFYHVASHTQVYIACTCDPNDQTAPVRITVKIPVPSKNKYAKFADKGYTIEAFEALNCDEYLAMSTEIEARNKAITEMEEQLKALKGDLTKYAMNALGPGATLWK